MLKDLKGHKMSGPSHKVKINSFPGCSTQDMRDHVKPLLRKNPDRIILHVGTNSLRESATPRSCAEEILNLVREIQVTAPEIEVAVSSLIDRSDDEELA